jgi:hypothetical protein
MKQYAIAALTENEQEFRVTEQKKCALIRFRFSRRLQEREREREREG